MNEPVPFALRLKNCADELARRGPSALGALYDLTAVRLVRYAITWTRNQHDAEDVLQAAMVRIALHPQRLASAVHPWAYFLRIVRNEAIELLRKRGRSESLPGSVPALFAAPPIFDDPESREMIRTAIHQLPPEQLEVVALKIWEGLTFAEIGEVLAISPNTAASRYRYALDKLSHRLRPLRDEVWHD